MISNVEFNREDLAEKHPKLSEKELLAIAEMGTDKIDSASSFVSYISEMYGLPKSSMWYNLKRLKKCNLVDFATKDEKGKSLHLTEDGINIYKSIKSRKEELIEKFSEEFDDDLPVNDTKYYRGIPFSDDR